ncbi:methylated-DNA--[protein]-cysteine S-methyltransferase [Staphylococcus sp. GDY8P85P]|uniref:methylated-DNA--[protein]-cysteine S-methyltransferase n=1 Tax=Staphylococcus sp. GDY8P85P TaxID=2804138 RepID=UPI001AEBD9D7|nr:methylated-DNA--[protein]-cysteine S-methyltransferase [Staphylococcus sp. GDY8P85P]
MAYSMLYESPVQNLELISDGKSLTHLLYKYQDTTVTHPTNPELDVFKKAVKWLNQYFDGQRPTIDFSLKPEGTAFQKCVWQKLQHIEYGQLRTYGEIAHLVGEERGKPNMSAQAVGGAVGSNPISIIIPCHRVVGKDGSLTGYGGTINHKIKLLELEKVDMTHLYRPKHSTKP